MSCCGGKCASGVDPTFKPYGKTSRYPDPKRFSRLEGSFYEDAAFPQYSSAATKTSSDKESKTTDDSDPYTYAGANLCAVDFPLGGFGTGHIFLQGDGTLGQFAIVNQVKEESEPVHCMPSCFFGISGVSASKSVGQFILSAPTTYTIGRKRGRSASSHAIKRLQTLPGVASLTMRATYPRAVVDYDIKGFPVQVSLEAISPLIPGNVKDSSLPLAIFTFTLKNTSSADAVTVRLFQAQQNLVGWNGHDDCTSGTNKQWGGNVNTVARIDGSSSGGILMSNPSLASSAENYGTVCLSSLSTASASAAAATSVIIQAKDEDDLWTQFVKQSDVPLASAKDSTASAAQSSWAGAVVQTVTIQPNKEATVRFALTWHFPNRMRDTSVGSNYKNILPEVLGNYYASQWFKGAVDVIQYAESNASASLLPLTSAFVDNAYSTTIPSELLDSAVGRLAVLRSPTMWRCADGTVLGSEGNGCCPLNCTHVYGYTTLIERLYPSLAKNMRESDFIRNFDIKAGGCTMRFGTGGWAIDGALACIIKTYLAVRQADANLSWLPTVWPNVLQQMKYIMDTFDISGDGVIRAAQQNTYDTAMFGANTFIGSYYVCALRATAAMATLMHDSKTASELLQRAQLSAANYDKLCYEETFGYFVADVTKQNCKYSYGPGCFVDQICAAGLALACDFGYLFDAAHERSARKAIVENNVVTMPPFQDLQQHFFPGDVGITVCTYPNGKLGDGMMYENLVSSGFTSPVIAGLIFDDNLDLAVKVAGYIRRRHDGRNRSPWNEPECNLLYSRAMAHWNQLDQSCGLAYDATAGSLRVRPTESVLKRCSGNAFACPIVLDAGWGQYTLAKDESSVSIACQYGNLTFSTLEISVKASSASATLGKKSVRVSTNGSGILSFPDGPVSIAQGSAFVITLTKSRVRISVMATVSKKGMRDSHSLLSDHPGRSSSDRERTSFALHWTLLAVVLAFLLGLALGIDGGDYIFPYGK